VSAEKLNYSSLLDAIGKTHLQAQVGAAGAVNRHLIMRNWIIGAYLVEYEQNGRDRAEYGTGLLKRVAVDLKKQGVGGCSRQMLERMRQFFREYPQMVAVISSSVVSISFKTPNINMLEICSPSVSILPAKGEKRPSPLSLEQMFRLSWTHWIALLAIDDPWKRAFYENEHLRNVAEMAAGFASAFDSADWGWNAGILHDLGKVDDAAPFCKRGVE